MSVTFSHLEILGPRARLDRWLAVLQDEGACHFADAMHGLEGETEIGRPGATGQERAARLVRSEAARALRAVERVLPPSPREDAPRDERPDWSLDPERAVGEPELDALRAEARDIAAALRVGLEAVRAAEAEVETEDARQAGLQALERAGEGAVARFGFALPRAPGRARALTRRLSREHQLTARAHGAVTSVVMLRASAPPSETVGEIARAAGARAFEYPGAWSGRPVAAAREEVAQDLAAARERETAARAALAEIVARVGRRGRTLLDGLEDAEGRDRLHAVLAATEHVVSARVYVRQDEASRVGETLNAQFGQSVVVRPLDEADDAPTMARRLAPVPLAALRGFLPQGFGDLPLAAMLALFAPVATALVWSDVAGGLLLLLAGAALGAGARRGAPRADTALVAYVAGLAALVGGALGGRAMGAAGTAWFGSDWGLLPGWSGPPAGTDFVGVLQGILGLLGIVAALGSCLGVFAALRAGLATATGRRAYVGALGLLTVAGLAAAAQGVSSWAFTWWLAAPVGAMLFVALEGPRALIMRLGLDVVGVLRLAAVGAAGVVVVSHVFQAWTGPGLAVVVLSPLVLGIGALAIVADAAYLAMGVPYDLALGGRRFMQAFSPLRRRLRWREVI